MVASHRVIVGIECGSPGKASVRLNHPANPCSPDLLKHFFAGKMAQRLSTLASVPEDLSSVLNTFIK